MKFEKTKPKNIFTGKSFYIIIAICIVAIGATTWLGLRNSVDNTGEQPETESLDFDTSQDIPSAPSESLESPSADSVDTEKENEPYDSSTESQEESQKPIVAQHFVLPINQNIIKGFSDDTLVYSNTYRDMRVHNGIDIATKAGDPIRSSGNGRVIAVIEDAKLGKYVEIDHGNGITAKYCGLDDVYLSEGDIVDATSQIGTAGEVTEECLDASHIHLEFYKNGAPVDPLKIIYPEN